MLKTLKFKGDEFDHSSTSRTTIFDYGPLKRKPTCRLTLRYVSSMNSKSQ